MPRLVSLFVLATVGSACTNGPYANPLAGNWRVDRTVRAATAGCPSLTLPPLTMTLHPGFAQEIDLGPQQDNTGENAIAGGHIIFTTSELAIPGTSDTLVVKHDLETQQNDADHLIGTATAQGVGLRVDCRWDMDVIAVRASR